MAIAAFLKGLFGASSLLLGAILGIIWQPSRVFSAAFMAFGSGILLAALAFDITSHVYQQGGLIPLLLGFFLGGSLFSLATRYIDQKGGFLRRPSSSRRYLYKQRQETASGILNRLTHIELMRHMAPDEVQAIIPYLNLCAARPGDILCQEGKPGDSLYFILEGSADVLKDEHQVATLGPGEVFGEMAILTNEPRSATVVACTPMELYELKRADFNVLVPQSPSLSRALSRILARRLQATTQSQADATKRYQEWQQAVLDSTSLTMPFPEEQAMLRSLSQRSAPLAILCGSLIDNIPESAVIGITTTTGHVGTSFLFAVFMSNFPEALSSSMGMKKAGAQSRNVLLLWSGVVLLSGFSAVLGYLLQGIAIPALVVFIQAIAGGAILAMLASTMMPEAYELGGGSVSFSTILGFLLGFWISVSTV
ncbi:MAG: cyclic nucleotide-binding domain-containing protein [Cyanobacteria bacterium J06638_20]